MARWNPFAKKDPEGESSTPLPSSDPPSGGDPPESGDHPDQGDDGRGGIFGRFKQALKKTVDVLNTDIRDLVGKEGRLVDQEFLDELFTHLVKTDMGVGPAGKIRDGIGSAFRGRKVMMSDLVESAKMTIREIMQQDSGEIHMAESGPTVIMVVGVNGAGKTTSIAKLAYKFKTEGKEVVLGAGDTFRAAAVEQLTIWSERMGAEIVTGRQGSDPASVAYKATDAAKQSNAEICIVDTAGRLQTQTNLMEELGRIRRVIGNVIPEAPHEVLLVLDATAGQNAISQAKGFSEAAGCTGIILAKLDGTAKGGVAIPIQQEFGLPVKFVGLGETPDAFAPFDVNGYVDALFDEELDEE
jgi:fused signal recognition particle receptor